MPRKLFAVLIGIGGALLVLAVAVIWLVPSARPAPVPSPNGYDVFVAAGQKLRADDFAYDKASPEELRKRLEGDREVLNQVRSGLALQSRVPPVTESQMEKQLQELGHFKALTRVIEAEARLSRTDGRYSDAAASGCDIIRLAHASTRGGPIISAMVCVAIENRGLSVLEPIADKLDAKSRAETLAVLRKVQAASETVPMVLDNERAFVRQVYGAKGSVARLFTFKQLQATERKFAQLHQSAEARRKALIARLEKDKGS